MVFSYVLKMGVNTALLRLFVPKEEKAVEILSRAFIHAGNDLLSTHFRVQYNPPSGALRVCEASLSRRFRPC